MALLDLNLHTDHLGTLLGEDSVPLGVEWWVSCISHKLPEAAGAACPGPHAE